MLKRNAKYGVQTRAIHAGERPDPVTGASAPNIAMSTTYVVSDASAQFPANALGEGAPFVDCRWGNPTVQQLEQKLAGDGIFRLSVGLEDAEDLIADIERALG